MPGPSIMQPNSNLTSVGSWKFTDVALRQMPPNANAPSKDHYDSVVTGLVLRVASTGSKTFSVYYRIGGRARRLTLGRYPLVTLQHARERAMTALRLVNEGGDPARTKRDFKLGYADQLMGNRVAEYLLDHAKLNRASTTKETSRILLRDFAKLRDVPVTAITTEDLETIFNAILARGTPSAANHAFFAVRAFFNWLADRKRVSVNPCAGITRPNAPEPRERVLSDVEVARLWRATITMGYPYGSLVQILILTGLRRGDVSRASRLEVDLMKNLWTLPARRKKGKKKHVVPIGDLAKSVIVSLPNIHAELLFSSTRMTGPIKGFSKWKRTLDDLSGVYDWHIHDIRHLFSTGLAELKTPPHIIDLLMAHHNGSMSPTAKIYNHYAYLDEMRAALAAWEARVKYVID